MVFLRQRFLRQGVFACLFYMGLGTWVSAMDGGREAGPQAQGPGLGQGAQEPDQEPIQGPGQEAPVNEPPFLRTLIQFYPAEGESLEVLQSQYREGFFPVEGGEAVNRSLCCRPRRDGNEESFSFFYKKAPLGTLRSLLTEDSRRNELVPYEQNLSQEEAVIAAQKNPNNKGREKISDATRWPYSAVGLLQIVFSDGQGQRVRTFTGTGFLVGPHHVLTAAHHLYDPRLGGWARRVLFSPEKNGDGVAFAYQAKVILLPAGWQNGQQDQVDFALILLGESVGFRTGWLGIEASRSILLETRQVEFLGYPGNEELLPESVEPSFQRRWADPRKFLGNGLWRSAGRVNVENEQGQDGFSNLSRLSYDFQSSSGQSGSPLLYHDVQHQKAFVIGLHLARLNRPGAMPLDGGLRVSLPLFNKIISWLRTYQRREVQDHPELAAVRRKEDLFRQFKEWERTVATGRRSREVLQAHFQLGLYFQKGEGHVRNEAEATRHFQEVLNLAEVIPDSEAFKFHALAGLFTSYQNQKQWELAQQYGASIYELFGNYPHPLERLNLEGSLFSWKDILVQFSRASSKKATNPRQKELAFRVCHQAISRRDGGEHGEGEFLLSQFYARGEGVDLDHGLALRYCQNAADRGYAEAQYQLGLMYAQGLGVPANLNEAQRWMGQAKDQGNAQAQQWLEQHQQQGSGCSVL